MKNAPSLHPASPPGRAGEGELSKLRSGIRARDGAGVRLRIRSRTEAGPPARTEKTGSNLLFRPD